MRKIIITIAMLIVLVSVVFSASGQGMTNYGEKIKSLEIVGSSDWEANPSDAKFYEDEGVINAYEKYLIIQTERYESVLKFINIINPPNGKPYLSYSNKNGELFFISAGVDNGVGYLIIASESSGVKKGLVFLYKPDINKNQLKQI